MKAKKLSDMKIAKRLVSYISTWVYSDGVPPDPINDLFLRWMVKGLLPTSRELEFAIDQSDGILARRAARLSLIS